MPWAHLSLFLSVTCWWLVFYQLILHCITWECYFLQKQGHFPLDLVTNSELSQLFLPFHYNMSTIANVNSD